MIKNFYNKGVAIAEILVVLAVLAVIFMVVLPQFSKIRELQLLKNTTSDILSSLNKAQSQTLASVNSSSYGVHFQADKVIIFTGTTYSAGASSNVSINISSPVAISNVTFGGVNASSGNIYFNRLYGTPNTFGTVTVSSTNYSKIITISATGVASSN